MVTRAERRRREAMAKTKVKTEVKTVEDKNPIPEGFAEALTARTNLLRELVASYPDQATSVTLELVNGTWSLSVRGPRPSHTWYCGYPVFWHRAHSTWSPTQKLG